MRIVFLLLLCCFVLLFNSSVLCRHLTDSTRVFLLLDISQGEYEDFQLMKEGANTIVDKLNSQIISIITFSTSSQILDCELVPKNNENEYCISKIQSNKFFILNFL